MAGINQFIDPQSLFKLGGLFDDDADTTVVSDIDASPTELLGVVVVSADAAATYLKLFDDKAPTNGTDKCDFQFRIAASGSLFCVFYPPYPRFDVALSYLVSSAAGTPAGSNPSTPPDVYIWTSGGVLRATPATESAAQQTATVEISQSNLNTALASRMRHVAKLTATAGQFVSNKKFFGGLVDNSLNTAAHSWLKMYDASSGPTVGTTDPALIFRANKGKLLRFGIWSGIPQASGSNNWYGACVSEGGGTEGNTAPTNDVQVRLAFE